MGQQGTHGGTHPAEKWPLMPRGGYQRAIPRDALTGAPIDPNAAIIHLRPDPYATRDNGAHSHTPRKPHRRAPPPSAEPLPPLHVADADFSDADEDEEEGDDDEQ